MLAPDHVRIGAAGGDQVRILDIGIVGLVGRHEGGAQALPRQPPALARIVALPDPAAGDGHRHLAAVPGIDPDGVGRRQFGPAAEPALPLRQVVETRDQGPALAAVAADEKGAGRDPGPDQPRLIRAAG